MNLKHTKKQRDGQKEYRVSDPYAMYYILVGLVNIGMKRIIKTMQTNNSFVKIIPISMLASK